MAVIEETRAVKAPEPIGLPPALRPFRHRMFAALWVGSLLANFGVWVHQVGAAWLMLSLAVGADEVALIQTATAMPMLLLSLIAGAAADLWDRRIAFLAGQSVVALSAACLALLGLFEMVTPLVLLGLTFALSSGATWRQPAYQASVGELVPRGEIAAAVALNSINFNLARSLGPALGGFIIIGFGAVGTFAFNAVANLFVIAILLFWRRRMVKDDLPRERLLPAMGAGLRYVRGSPGILVAVLRAGLFGLTGSALWALLPLSADGLPDGGPLTYGLLLGALGMGAVLGAVTIGELRRRLRNEGVILLGHVLFGAASLALALIGQLWPLLLFLLFGGLAWMIILSTFNVTVQLTAAEWVKARALSIYFTGLFGGMSLGSWLWGEMAERLSLEWAMAAAGIATLAVGVIGNFLRLPTNLARDLTVPLAIDDGSPLRPPGVDSETGFVAVTVSYHVDPAKADAFLTVMRRLRRLRRRDGALRWTLYQDIDEPTRWVEAFVLASWLDHLRHMRRTTVGDRKVLEAIAHFHQGDGPPKVTHLIARGFPNVGWPPGRATAAM
ncbi:MFS transporter [Marinivivus vitaminiproducens]|uniref:MFS transporter n=1 Tax=Marinivivus vitaminiproducens TaxID=3035935 RepID=UPI00279CBACF|nr:MFS transporter [Geminicoccaceae bacterium SCSIO 64248]